MFFLKRSRERLEGKSSSVIHLLVWEAASFNRRCVLGEEIMGNENTRFVWARPEFYAFGEIPPAAWQVNGTYLNLKRQEHMDSWALGAVAM